MDIQRFNSSNLQRNCDYPITTPSGRVVSPSASRSWTVDRAGLEELLADNRIWFGKNGSNVPRKKTFLSEVQGGVVPMTLWKCTEVGHNQEAKKEVKQFEPVHPFATPKPERLIKRIINIATNEGDLVLDSFLGSGTTVAVAHKMGRRWIGVELGEHCYTHCKVRMDMVIDGEQGGISKAMNWQGGGGYKFYELAPTLIVKDKHGNPVFSEHYNAEMLVAAVAKLNGYFYAPDGEVFWKQGYSQDNSFIYVTTQYLTSAMLDSIAGEVGQFENLLIYAPAFDVGLNTHYDNISVRKIPQAILSKCEYGVDGYDLNIVNPPEVDEDEEEVYEDD